MGRELRRGLVLAVLAIASGAPSAFAQEVRKPAAPAAPANRPQPKPPDPARMNQLLRAWEQQSARLKTLDVNIKRKDRSKMWGDEEYVGRAILKSPNFVWLNFDKVDNASPKKPELKPHERIVCTGNEVWQYRIPEKQIFIFPLDRQDKKRALEEGPLPFLFNMRAADAEARYKMQLIEETKDWFIIGVLPKEKIDIESFSQAFIQLNRKTFLPDRIFLVSPDQKSTKDFRLHEVKPNAPVRDENFKPTPLGKPWQVVRDLGDGGGARQQPLAPGPAQPRRR